MCNVCESLRKLLIHQYQKAVKGGLAQVADLMWNYRSRRIDCGSGRRSIKSYETNGLALKVGLVGHGGPMEEGPLARPIARVEWVIET